MNTHLIRLISGALFLVTMLIVVNSSQAAPSLVGVNTDGTVYQIDTTTGALTMKAQEQTSSFSLGGFTRKSNKVYYIAAPSGTSENSIYTLVLKTGLLTHVDLDRSDEVRALFFSGQKLYAVFYDGNQGTVGLYRVNPTTGVTKLVADFSSLDVEPIGGAYAKLGDFYYMLAKPNTDSTLRRLLRFKLRATGAKLFNVVTSAAAPITCDRLKVNQAKQNFVCLASPTTSQVDVCKLKPNGVASCSATLANVLRLAGGHTMMTPNEKTYYALVYEIGDENSQRLIQFTPAGAVKRFVTVSSIVVGADFQPPAPTPTK